LSACSVSACSVVSPCLASACLGSVCLASASIAFASASVSNGCGATTSVEAKGHVYYAAADGRRLHGDNAFYDLSASTVTITGDVTAVDASNNVMRGTRMVYNTKTGEGHVEGGGKGPGAKTRPRGVFYPKDSDAAPAASGAPDPKKKAAK